MIVTHPFRLRAAPRPGEEFRLDDRADADRVRRVLPQAVAKRGGASVQAADTGVGIEEVDHGSGSRASGSPCGRRSCGAGAWLP